MTAAYTCEACRETTVDREFSMIPRFLRQCPNCGFTSHVRDSVLELMAGIDDSELPDQWDEMDMRVRVQYIQHTFSSTEN